MTMPTMGVAEVPAAVNHRAAPADQGLTTAPSPLTATVPPASALGTAIDQAMTGNAHATAQLNAILSDPNAVAALTAPDERPIRGATDLPSRTPREQLAAQQIPSIEQINALDQLTRQPAAPTMEELLAQVRGEQPAQQQQPVAQQPQAQHVSPLAGPPIQQLQMPGVPAPQQAIAPQQVQQQAPAQDPNQALMMQMLATMNRQAELLQQALMPQPEPQFDVRALSAQDQLRWAYQTLTQAEGINPQHITRDTLISRLKHEENRLLAQEFAAYREQNDQRWNELGNHASQYRMTNEIGSTLAQQLAPYDQARVTPELKSMLDTFARNNAAAGMPIPQAVQTAVAAVRHLLAAPAPATQPAPVQQFQPPPQQPQFQAPAYAGMNQLQIQQMQRSMQAASIPGNGAGRYGPTMPDLKTLDALVLRLN